MSMAIVSTTCMALIQSQTLFSSPLSSDILKLKKLSHGEAVVNSDSIKIYVSNSPRVGAEKELHIGDMVVVERFALSDDGTVWAQIISNKKISFPGYRLLRGWTKFDCLVPLAKFKKVFKWNGPFVKKLSLKSYRAIYHFETSGAFKMVWKEPDNHLSGRSTGNLFTYGRLVLARSSCDRNDFEIFVQNHGSLYWEPHTDQFE